MIITNKKNNKFTINGTSNARECGLFDGFYAIAGPKSKHELTSLLVNESGNLILCDFIPHIREDEVRRFLTSPFRIYRNELSNGIITTSIRGMSDMDFVHLPHSSPVDLRRVKPQGQIVDAFMVDTATDEIKGIRMVGISDRTASQLLHDWITIEQKGFSIEDINRTLATYVYPYSTKEFQNRSVYVGRDISSTVSHNLYTSCIEDKS